MCVYFLSSEEGIESPEVGAADICEPRCGCWEQTPVLCKNSQCSQLLHHLQPPLIYF